MINQNLLRLKLVGRSGNADPHYLRDWVNIEIDSEDTFGLSTDGSSDNFRDKDYCTFPSVRIVEIFYEKINTKSNPQFLVKKM